RDRLHDQLGDESAGSSSAAKASTDHLVRLIQALDDEHERFTRRNDLYSLEVALIKAADALRAERQGPRPVEQEVAAREQKGARPSGSAAASSQQDPGRPAAADQASPRQPATPVASVAPAAKPEEVPPANQVPAGKPFSWHAVKSAAGPQLKAFLQPAAGAGEGHSLSLTYEERYKFHFEQLLSRRHELETLIESVAGPGYRLQIHGPGGKRA